MLGDSVSPSDYDDTSAYSYVSMASIRHWRVDIENSAKVSGDYYDSRPKKRLHSGDISIARSGEAIGKVALVDAPEIEAIFSDFTMRVRVSEDNAEFLSYFLMSSHFQQLIHCNKRGHANFNIFPVQISQFPIPAVSIQMRDEIVDEISASLGEFDMIRSNLNRLRAQRDDLLAIAIEKELVAS